jgi:hypothetical protein
MAKTIVTFKVIGSNDIKTGFLIKDNHYIGGYKIEYSENNNDTSYSIELVEILSTTK